MKSHEITKRFQHHTGWMGNIQPQWSTSGEAGQCTLGVGRHMLHRATGKGVAADDVRL